VYIKIDRKTAGMYQKPVLLIDDDGYPVVEVPTGVNLRELLKIWEEDGSPKNYKECMNNIQELIEVQERALKMERRGEKYAQAIREWILAAQSATGTIPSYGRQDKVQYPRSKKIITYYNEIMKRGTKDFESFAGSLQPIVISKEIVDWAVSRAEALTSDLEIDQKGEPFGESNLLEAAVFFKQSMPRLMSLAEKFVDDLNATKVTIQNLERKINSICASRVSEESLANLASNFDSYREEFLFFCNQNKSIGKRVTRILEFATAGTEAEEIKKSARWLLDVQAAKLLKASHLSSNLTNLTSKISAAADRLIDVVSEEADSINLKLKEPSKRWRQEFNGISKEQIDELRNNVDVSSELKKNNMRILYVSWSDVGRAQGSCGGPNITDMQFFAVPPLKLRPAAPRYHDLDRGLFCIFPAVRSPNFTDEVDIRTASIYTFKARDLQGEVKDVTLAFFLKNIGRYITDLDPDANWGDEIDLKEDKMQVASQFSILPLLECANYKVELGISAFGYQKKNLHIIVGPSGDLGWAPEGPGYKRIFFRDTAGIMDAVVGACEPYFQGSIYICTLISRFISGFGQELRAIALVPEDRKEVSRAFFKAPVENESIQEEAKRYGKVENKLIHIQIEMVRGEEKGDLPTNEMFTCDGLAQAAGDLRKRKNTNSRVIEIREKASEEIERKISGYQLDYNSVTQKQLPMNYPDFGCMPDSYVLSSNGCQMLAPKGIRYQGDDGFPESCSNSSDSPDSPDLGLLLTRVQMGDSVGRADNTDTIPFGSKRSKGMAVRVTEMFYSVARNAEFTQPRIYRFMQQMSFAQRAGNLAHGSLVTGEGTWNEKLPPITLTKGY